VVADDAICHARATYGVSFNFEKQIASLRMVSDQRAAAAVVMPSPF